MENKTKKIDDKALDVIMDIIMCIEFILVVVGYVALKSYVSLLWAEVWIITLYGCTLKRSIELSKPEIGDALQAALISKNDDEEQKEDKQKEISE